MGFLEAVGRLERRWGTDSVGAYDRLIGAPQDEELEVVWSGLDAETRDWVQRAAMFGWVAEDPVLAALVADRVPAAVTYVRSTRRQQQLTPLLAGVVPALTVALTTGVSARVAIAAVLISGVISLGFAMWAGRRVDAQVQALETAALANRAVATGAAPPARGDQR